ncbi:MAG: hypothetical protein P9L92_10250 [Candidatus Electryonea clarkiae]|nr:hypothetical protein [Candidatus Electryonea clarkiae]
MTDFEESGMKITLPDNDCFRFEDITALSNIRNKGLKDMDFGWWDNSKNVLFLLEVKETSDPSSYETAIVEKVVDTLLTLSASWIPTLRGKSIARELPSSCQSFLNPPHKLQIVIIFKIQRTNIQGLHTLQDSVRNKLEGKVKLFDMVRNSVKLMDISTAINFQFPVIQHP